MLMNPIRHILELNEALHNLLLQRPEKLQPMASLGALEKSIIRSKVSRWITMSMPKVIKIGLQAYVKLLKAFKTQYFFMMFNSFCLFSRILLMNGISHAYNFKTFIPDSISFINFILESFAFSWAVCKTSPILLPIEKGNKSLV